MTTQTFIGTLVVEECCNCGVAFGLTSDMRKRLVANKKTFYCPNGHPQSYVGESASDRAQRLAGLLDQAETRERQQRELRWKAEHKADYAQRARKAVSTRLKKTKHRIANGVCPCCQRTFQNLQAHMHTKHPHFDSEPSM